MEYIYVLWDYLLVSAPYLVLGFTASGIIHHYISIETIKNWLGHNTIGSVAKAALVGVPLPLCSCSVIPTAVTLRKAGASNGSTAAFLISTPESGVDSISITYGLMDLPMTILRPIAAFTSAFVAGVMHIFLNDFEYVDSEPVKSCCAKKKGCSSSGIASSSAVSSGLEKLKGVFSYGFGKLSNDISFWLTVGILLGALIDLVVPDNFFSNTGMVENRLLILLIGIPLYICASASTPIAVSLMLKGLSPGSALLFLLVGPATNISNIAVLQKYIGKRGVIINIVAIIIVALIFSFIADYAYAHFFEVKLSDVLVKHEHKGAWWQVASAILLIFLLLKGLYIKEVKPRFKR